MAARPSSSFVFSACIAVGAVALCVSCSKPSPGVLALQSSRDAVRAAKSWQSGVTVQMPSGQRHIVLLEKVECPGRDDRTNISYDAQPSSTHEIWFDGGYYKKEISSAWSSADVKMPANCGHGPSLAWDGILYDDLDAAASNGEVRAGKAEQPAQPNVMPCTWWEVAPAKGAEAHYSVCVSEADHLPRIVRSHEHNLIYVYTLTDWNATSVALPTDIVAP
jgi:hypothetical protein